MPPAAGLARQAAEPAAAAAEHDVGELIRHHVFDGRTLDFFGHELQLPQIQIGGVDLGLTKHMVFVALGAVITFLVVWGASRNIERVPRGLRNALEAIIRFFRNEVIYPNLGERYGAMFTPLLLTFFLFILVTNLLGMIPCGSTATSNFYITGGLAAVTLTCMIVGGMLVQGPVRFWVTLVPHGIPAPVVPIIFFIELVGLIIKPFALMVRLAANMTAGHIVILALMSLIWVAGSWLFAVVPVAVIVAFSVLELLVILIQAFVFTLLSAVFIGMSLDPQH